jgi:tetratricopeptide (TPR) repeat protein
VGGRSANPARTAASSAAKIRSSHYQQALPICQEIDDRWCEAIALVGLSRAYFHLGNYEEALSCSQRALHIRQEIDDPWSQTFAMLNIGAVHRKLQRFDDALNYFIRR